MAIIGNLATTTIESALTTEPTVVTYTDTPTNIIHAEDQSFWRPETEVVVEVDEVQRPDLNQDIENNVNFQGFERLVGEAESRGKLVYEVLKDLGIPNTIDNIVIDYKINQLKPHEYGCTMGYFDKKNRTIAVTAEAIYEFPIESVIETIVHEKWHGGDISLNPSLKESLSTAQLVVAEESMSTIENLVDVKLKMMDEKGLRNGIFMSGYEEYHFNHYRQLRDKYDAMPFLSNETKAILLAGAKEVLVAEVFAIAGEQLYVDPNGQNIKMQALLDKAQLHGYELPDLVKAIKDYNAVVFMGLEQPDLALVDQHLNDFRAKYLNNAERQLRDNYVPLNINGIAGKPDVAVLTYPTNIPVIIDSIGTIDEESDAKSILEMYEEIIEQIMEILIERYEEFGLKIDMVKIRKEAEEIFRSYN